jgi:NAD(P)-dependent dehydrogenase (short-subunit alcohol dehydrogenase family)
MNKVLITGAGTGFGHEVAMRLAKKGFDVIASVEIYAQVQTLKRDAAARAVSLQVEKLDVTNDGDRKKALSWNVEILINNAGVLEGGSVLDIPASNMRQEFEVNVIGPLLLDLSPFLRQRVKTQNPLKRRMSHGVVEKDVHQGVQAGCGATAGAREFQRRGGAGVGGEPERAASLAA